MDTATEKATLENEQAAIQQYLDHPITKNIIQDNAEQQDALIDLILNHPVTNVETFLAREQALGHLRGLRRGRSIIDDKLEEIETQLKELKD